MVNGPLWSVGWLIHSQAPTVQRSKFRNGYIISSHTSMGMLFFIYAGINVDMC